MTYPWPIPHSPHPALSPHREQAITRPIFHFWKVTSGRVPFLAVLSVLRGLAFVFLALQLATGHRQPGKPLTGQPLEMNGLDDMPPSHLAPQSPAPEVNKERNNS